MTWTYPAMLGLLTLVAMAGCAGDDVDVLPYPPKCYDACGDCCGERHTEMRDICFAACSDSPINPEGFPDCAGPPECPIQE
jgi:hypothetical protein